MFGGWGSTHALSLLLSFSVVYILFVFVLRFFIDFISVQAWMQLRKMILLPISWMSCFIDLSRRGFGQSLDWQYLVSVVLCRIIVEIDAIRSKIRRIYMSMCLYTFRWCLCKQFVYLCIDVISTLCIYIFFSSLCNTVHLRSSLFSSLSHQRTKWSYLRFVCLAFME